MDQFPLVVYRNVSLLFLCAKASSSHYYPYSIIILYLLVISKKKTSFCMRQLPSNLQSRNINVKWYNSLAVMLSVCKNNFLWFFMIFLAYKIWCSYQNQIPLYIFGAIMELLTCSCQLLAPIQYTLYQYCNTHTKSIILLFYTEDWCGQNSEIWILDYIMNRHQHVLLNQTGSPTYRDHSSVISMIMFHTCRCHDGRHRQSVARSEELFQLHATIFS